MPTYDITIALTVPYFTDAALAFNYAFNNNGEVHVLHTVGGTQWLERGFDNERLTGDVYVVLPYGYFMTSQVTGVTGVVTP